MTDEMLSQIEQLSVTIYDEAKACFDLDLNKPKWRSMLHIHEQIAEHGPLADHSDETGEAK